MAELKIDPYVMLFEKWDQPQIMKDYQKFINGHAYKNFTFEEYLMHKNQFRQQERQEIELTAF